MPNLASAYVQIIPSAQGIKGMISQAMGGEADAAGTEAGNSIVGKVKGIIAAAGIGTALKAALTEGADLEQSIGGIETLFKGSADKVKALAADAFRTTGQSANEYMQNVTGFSASLLQGLGGDTEKASDIAHMAMVDMSDNANKMGTDLGAIQTAYQGFAKQNYTMLDNLKLGYGGTKTEMERLLADAEKLTGVKYDINNLADVYSAIHAVQENLDIAGTTAKEAASTLSGSFAAMQAAAKNVMGNLTLGQDLAPALNGLSETVVTFVGGNLIPAVGRVLQGLPTLVIGIVTSLGPQLTKGALSLMNSFSSGIAQSIPRLLAQALPMILQFSQVLRSHAGQLVDAGLNLVLQLAKGIANSIPTLVAYVPDIVTNIAGIINDNAPKLLSTGLKVIQTMVKGLIAAIPVIKQHMPEILMAVVSAIQAVNWMALGKQIINGLVKGVKVLASHIPSALRSIVSAGSAIVRNYNWLTLGKTIIVAIKNGVMSLASAIPGALKTIAGKAFSAFKGISWPSVGKAVINGIVKGISGGAGAIVKAAKNAAKSAFDAAKDFLGIHSPSRKFAWIGEMADRGLAAGLENNVKPVQDAMRSISAMTTGTMTANMALRSTPTALTASDSSDPAILISVLELLQEYLPELMHRPIALDGDRLVSLTAPRMDKELNRAYARTARGGV